MIATDPHEATAELAARSAVDLRDSMATGPDSSADVTARLLDRVAAIDAKGTSIALRSILALSESASDEAAALDAARADGRPLGPLHGVAVLIKDNIEAVGLPGTAGSLALSGRAVMQDSPIAARLRAAGAVILGAANMSEWANCRSPRSTSGWSAVGGLTGNPWALDRSAGGSSSGSGAAVAAGIVPFAVGTETNGSITCPAALNGVVGIKATVGSIPTQGVVPVCASQDAPGPLARTVRDAALLLEVLAASTGLQEACTSQAARPLRVGVAEGWLTWDPATDAVFEAAVAIIEPLVAQVTRVVAPAADFSMHEDQMASFLAELVDDLGAYLTCRAGDGVQSLADVIAFNEAHSDQELAYFGQENFAKALASGGRAGALYQGARQRNVAWAHDACLDPAFATGVDVLIAPAYRPAWKSDLTHGDVLSGGGAICTPAAILGWPILTLPMGLVNGLPLGLSILGPAHSEAALISLGHAFEQALGLTAAGGLRPLWKVPARG